jgi:hypothetical protein
MARRIIPASRIIAYQDGGQRHLQDGVIVIEGNQIVHIGPVGSRRLRRDPRRHRQTRNPRSDQH